MQNDYNEKIDRQGLNAKLEKLEEETSTTT